MNDQFGNKEQLKSLMRHLAGNSVAPMSAADLKEVKDAFDLSKVGSIQGVNPYYGRPCWAKTNRWLVFDPDNKKGLIIKAYTNIRLPDGSYKYYKNDEKIDLSEDVTQAGKDYYVNMVVDGKTTTYSASLQKQVTGVTIGRFHTLCANVGNNVSMILPEAKNSGILVDSDYLIKPYDETQNPEHYELYNKKVLSVTTGASYDVVEVEHPLSGFQAGDILPESVFCPSFMPKCNHEDAMVYDVVNDICVDIYLQSGVNSSTRSEYNANIVVNRPAGLHNLDFISVGKRLLFENEYMSIALGSNEKTNIVGSETKSTVGGHADTNNRRMISAVGCEECCGFLWQWLSDLTGWTTPEWSAKDGQGSFGLEYGSLYVLIAGGGYDDGDRCGSASRCSGYVKSTAAPNVSARGCCGLVRFN